MGYTEKEPNYWGNDWEDETEIHYDDHGRKIGETRHSENIFGDRLQEHYDNSGKKIGETRKELGLFEDDFAGHYDAKGKQIGYSKNEPVLFGDDIQVHYDTGGRQVGESHYEEQMFGDVRKVHRGEYFKARNTTEKQEESSEYWYLRLVGWFVKLFLGMLIWSYYTFYYKIPVAIFRYIRRSLKERKERSNSQPKVVSKSSSEALAAHRSTRRMEQRTELKTKAHSRPSTSYHRNSISERSSDTRPRTYSESHSRTQWEAYSSKKDQISFVLKSMIICMIIGGLAGGGGLLIGKTITTITGVENLYAGFVLGAMIGWTVGAILGAVVGGIFVAIKR